jgi:hypothetical protein
LFARGIVHMPATCLEAAEKVCMTACAQVKVRAQSQHDEVLEGRGGLGIHHAAAAPGGSGSLGCTRAAHSRHSGGCIWGNGPAGTPSVLSHSGYRRGSVFPAVVWRGG